LKNVALITVLSVLIWALGFAAGWRVASMEEPLDGPVMPTTGDWVDLLPAGWHFIACAECGYTYRFFYNAPAPWRATLSHDPLATEIMRDMMDVEPLAPEDHEKGPPEPEEPEIDL
jgi:hypothetical protein